MALLLEAGGAPVVIASRLLADPRTPARLERHSPRSELVANTTREPYFAMTRNTEGSHGTHATLAHVTRPEILTYLKHKDYEAYS